MANANTRSAKKKKTPAPAKPTKKAAREAKRTAKAAKRTEPQRKAQKAAASTSVPHKRGEKLTDKKRELPSKEHRWACVTDANRIHDSVIALHESAFDGPKLHYNGQWYSHIDDLPDGTWRYAPM